MQRPEDDVRTGGKRAAVLEALGEPRTVAQAAVVAKMDPERVKYWIQWLKRQGLVERVDRVKCATRINQGAGRVSGQWLGVYRRKPVEAQAS